MTTTHATTPTDLALGYAASGWPVFPCDPATKQPLTPKGFKDASLDHARIEAWWAKDPAAMIGVPTGSRSDIWVLDIDNKPDKDGFRALAALQAEHGALPETVTCRTPSGGSHIYFKCGGIEVRNRGNLEPGIDVRGEGGYVIAPGSVRADGCSYEWTAQPDDVADAPPWLLAKVVKPRAKDSKRLPGSNAPYVEAAIRDEMKTLVGTFSSRNNQLNDSAFAVGQFVGADALSHAEAETRLYGAATANGYVEKDGESATRATIKSGLEAGIAKPREIPEPNAGTVDARTDTLITATPYVWRAASDFPGREFIYGKHLIRGYITCDAAPGGVGKSSLVIVDALAMVTGRMLLEDEPDDKLRVWLWNGEDPREEIERRIAAACGYYKISDSKIGGRLFVDTGREKEIVIVKEVGNKIEVATPVVDAVKEAIRANKIDCFIVDPFVTTHGVSENDNTKIAAVAQQWAYIADECRCAVQLVHHVRKGDGRELTVEDMRGGGALANAARAVRLLNPMNIKEAEAAGLNPEDRFSFFKVVNGKSNLTPRSDRAEWRELHSYRMMNEAKVVSQRKKWWLPDDRVGVVRQWRWPEAAAVAEVPPDTLMAIIARLGVGEFREDSQAANWAGHVVAEVLELNADDPADKKRVKKLLAGWVKTGVLKIETHRDKARKEKKFVVAA
jgi:Bifunctional DNA primase/polymerase, N-terminal/AAA domain